jgi:hypothetical protein
MSETVGVAQRPLEAIGVGQHLQGADDLRVERGAGPAPQLGQRRLRGESGPVRTI